MPGSPPPRDSAEGLFLGYSTNVHPGESLPQVYRSLREYAVPIRDRVFGRRPAGLELRLGIGAARGLAGRGERERFSEYLRLSQLRLFSINAYPLRNFHRRRVKQDVYRPAWTDPSRARWTAAIAGIFAELLEPGVTGSVSTLGGTYRPWGHGPSAFRRIARGYLPALSALAELEERTGKRIVLAVEPEPDTTFETASDLISFFEEYLLPAARARWSRRWPGARTEEVLRRHFTVNLDTCHLSVVFKSPGEEMARLSRAGMAIGKVHVTSALSLRHPRRSPRAYAELRAIDEPRYLHQLRGADRSGKVVYSAPDLDRLPPSLPRENGPPLEEIRSHFHVPVNAERWRRLSTTHDDTREAVLEAVRRKRCPQLVIETYTWPILAREDALVEGITREFRWLLKVIEEARQGRLL